MSYSIRWSFALAAVLCAALALGPREAQARFGKAGSRSSSSPSNEDDGSSKKVHAATPVGASRTDEHGSSAVATYASGYYDSYQPVPSGWCCYHPGYWFGYRPFFGYAPETMSPYLPPQAALEQQRPLLVALDAEAHGYLGGGVGLGLSLGVERDRLGFQIRSTGIFVPADDGSGGVDSIKLVNIHVTYALLSGTHGKLRVGAGLDSAFAPDIIMAGPGLGLSASLGLLGPIGAEASVTLTPFPYAQLDWNAGLSMGLGALGFRAGWRRLWLNDNGVVDGVAHQDMFSGPYVAVALAL